MYAADQDTNGSTMTMMIISHEKPRQSMLLMTNSLLFTWDLTLTLSLYLWIEIRLMDRKVTVNLRGMCAIILEECCWDKKCRVLFHRYLVA